MNHPESFVVVGAPSEPQPLAENLPQHHPVRVFNPPPAGEHAWRGERDLGIQRAEEHAEAVDPGWKDTAYAMLEQYCRERRGCRFTSEDVRRWCELRGFDSPVPKAWGGVFGKAARRKLIRRRPEGGVAKQRHGSPCPLWEAA